MLTVRIPELGELDVIIDTLIYNNGLFTIKCKNDRAIICDKISWQEDYIYEFGWVHIVSYIIDGVTTPCNHYTSIG